MKIRICRGSEKKQKGVSLVELLISEAISLLVIVGLLAFIGPSVAAISYIRGQSEIHDNGVFSYTQFRNVLLSAGYQGCDPSGTFTSTINVESVNISPRLRNWAYQRFTILGFDADEESRLQTQIGDGWQNVRYQFNNQYIGDMLAVQYPTGPALTLNEHNPATSELTFKGDLRGKLQSGQVIQLNDCTHSARMQINPRHAITYAAESNTTTVSYASEGSINCAIPAINSSAPAIGPNHTGLCDISTNMESVDTLQFSTNTRGHIVNSALFYIGYDADEITPALKRSGFATNAQNIYTETLIEGIENFRVQFGVDTDNDGVLNIYQNAAEVAQMSSGSDNNPWSPWERVVTIKVWLLIRSSEEIKKPHSNSSLLFPLIDGSEANCMTPTQSQEVNNSYIHACPFINIDQTEYARRVVSFSVAIPNNHL